MTVIVAARTQDGVSIAADSQVTYGMLTSQIATKLWTSGQFAFGAAGCIRTAQVLRFETSWPVYRPEEEDWESFVVRRIVPTMFSEASQHGVVHRDCGVQSMEVSIVVATGKNLAMIGGNGWVLVPPYGAVATGSGERQALGYLGREWPYTEDEVIGAARRASETAVGVDGNISVVSTNDLRVREA